MSFFLRFLLLSAGLHALVFAAVWLYPEPDGRHKVVKIYNISLTELPGPAGGGGKSLEQTPPKPPERQTPPEEKVALERKQAEKKPRTQPRKEPERLEVARVTPQAPAGPGQGPAGGGGSTKGAIQGPIALEGGVDFPYPWYLAALQKRVYENWNQRYIAGRNIPKAVVYFRIRRNGRIDDIKVETSSGITVLDVSALGAIRGIKQMQPLPEGYRGDSLGVHYTFITESK